MSVVAVLLHPTDPERMLPVLRQKFGAAAEIRTHFYKGLRDAWDHRAEVRPAAADTLCICVPNITASPRTSFLRILAVSYKKFAGHAWVADENGAFSAASVWKLLGYDVPKLALDLAFGAAIILYSWLFIVIFKASLRRSPR